MASKDKSPFFRARHTSGPGSLPREAKLFRPNTVDSMFPGDWAMPNSGAVWYDNKVEHHFVDTYDLVEPDVNRLLLDRRPLLYRSLGQLGAHYVADFRLVTMPTLPARISHYGEDGSSSVYKDMQVDRGTRIVDAIFYNSDDGPEYSGPDFLEEEAARFLRLVDAKLEDTADNEETDDEEEMVSETSRNTVSVDVSPSFASSPVGRLSRSVVTALDRASQRSAANRRAQD